MHIKDHKNCFGFAIQTPNEAILSNFSISHKKGGCDTSEAVILHNLLDYTFVSLRALNRQDKVSKQTDGLPQISCYKHAWPNLSAAHNNQIN